MLLLKRVDIGGDLSPSWRHWCPGCRMNHVIHTDTRAQPNGHRWTFDGNHAAPTFTPSVHVPGRCHYFINAGQLQFLSDSAHDHAGKTVPMVDLESIGEGDW